MVSIRQATSTENDEQYLMRDNQTNFQKLAALHNIPSNDHNIGLQAALHIR